MSELKKGPSGSALRLIREEKIAFRRFKDEVRKFRVLLPYISGRSGMLEKKISHLMEHREKEEGTLKLIEEKLEKNVKRLRVISKKEKEYFTKKDELTQRYKSMLAGDFSRDEVPSLEGASVEELRKGKEDLLNSLSGKFEKIEAEIESLGAERVELLAKRDRYSSRKAKLETKLERVREKVALYRFDIQKNILELNNHLGNEREIKKQYAEIVDNMKKSPKLSEWGNKVFREAFSTKMPDKTIIELKGSIGGPRDVISSVSDDSLSSDNSSLH
ncbi:MAG: hypothetical protein OEY64_00470 [Nitrospinota bacterium]|nr:hypothetical protein [Nitrospinota bacterium]